MRWTGGELPGHGTWLTTGEAAVLWSQVAGSDVTPERIRRWIKYDKPQMNGIDTWHAGTQYLVERDSFVAELKRRATNGLKALEEYEAETKKAPPPP
jgi:hypothetical protein